MGKEAHEIQTLTKLSRSQIFAPTRPDNFTSSTNSIGARVDSYHGTYLYHEFDFFTTSTIYISTKHEPKTPWGINLPLPLPLPALIQCHVVYPKTSYQPPLYKITSTLSLSFHPLPPTTPSRHHHHHLHHHFTQSLPLTSTSSPHPPNSLPPPAAVSPTSYSGFRSGAAPSCRCIGGGRPGCGRPRT